MGFMRGGGLFFIGLLFLISLLVGNVFLVLSGSLEYKNVKEKLTPVISNLVFGVIDLSEADANLNAMKAGCEGKEEIILDKDYQLVMSCDEIKTLSAKEIVDEQIQKFMNETYYKEYDCSFIECFGENQVPFFLVSKMSRDYIKNKYYYVLAFSVLLASLMFLLTKNKKNFPIIIGILFVLSSLPFMKLDVFSSAVSGSYASQIFSLFFEQAKVIFWWMFIIGIVFIGAGIGLRFWKFEKGNEITSKTKITKKKK